MARYRIGLMGVTTSSDYPRSIRLGIQNTIEELGHTLIHITELIPSHAVGTLPNPDAYIRLSVEIASRLDLDAVIYPVGCTATYLSGDSAKALSFLQSLDPANTLVMEREVPGYRCVTKDNAPGMHECMRYLIETCGFTKIAFVSGPEHSKGAHEREGIYFEEMAAHGLETPEGLFARSTFAGGRPDIIGKIIDEHPDVQAIACACDLIAYDAYAAIGERGLTVGDDIAVTGFDDHPRSAHIDPPMSTVHMSGYDFGCVAAREAVRLCEGLPQHDRILNSHFVARNSCGENVRSSIEYFRELLREETFPAEKFVDIVVDSTLSMAGPKVERDFRARTAHFIDTVRASYRAHLAHPEEDVLLFSAQDLAALFAHDYRDHLSLEGFHTVSITLLEALLEESPDEDANWVVEQISYLHLRIARLLNDATQERASSINRREWLTFHMVDSALRESADPTKAVRIMLEQLAEIGVVEADLFFLAEPVEFTGARSFGLSDRLTPVGRVAHGHAEVADQGQTIPLQGLLSHVLPRYGEDASCTIGGLIAGNELVGVAMLDASTLTDVGQLMALLNLGFALKHLQMIANEREMNAILSKNNLLLRQQSQHDEMTGLLNRRGFMNLLYTRLEELVGETAALLFLDLDGLKTINDTLGHDMGDEAIRVTGSVLRNQIPEDGLICRLGGDEFLAFVRVPTETTLDTIKDAVQRGIARYNEKYDRPFKLSISSGAAVFSIDDDSPTQVAQLMVEADEQLYEMKRQRKESRSYQG